ncbi:PucR family transcriptional regulator [Streptomyces sp. NPDC002643]
MGQLKQNDVLSQLVEHYAGIVFEAAFRDEGPSRVELKVCHSMALEAAGQAIPLHRIVARCNAESNRIWAGLLAPGKERGDPAVPPREPGAADGDLIRAASEAALSAILAGHGQAAWAAAAEDVRQRDRFLHELFADRVGLPDLLARGGQLGLQLGGCNLVIALAADGPSDAADHVVLRLEHALRTRFTADGCLAGRYADGVLALMTVESPESAPSTGAVRDAVAETMRQRPWPHAPWRIGIGRPRPGVHGIRLSCEEALEALDVARRTGIDSLGPRDSGLLIHRVLHRDRMAMAELIRTVLVPLTEAHHGPGPMLDTLEAYFTAGGMITRAARALHLSVRAVTYRLVKIKNLTQHDINVPEQRFALEAALRGARILDWPRRPLPEL